MNEDMIAIPQTVFITSIVKGVINIKANRKPFAFGTGEMDKPNKRIMSGEEIGSEYKITYSKLFEQNNGTKKNNKMVKEERRIGITFKDFFVPEKKRSDCKEVDICEMKDKCKKINEDEKVDICINSSTYPYPKFNDKHLKMILYLLHKKNSEIEFLASEFNRICGLTKDSVNTGSAYKILEDLTKINIRIITKKNELNSDGDDEYPLLNIVSKKTKIKNINKKEIEKQQCFVTETTLSRAKISITELIDFSDVGTMYVPATFFKLKIDKNGTLGATSLAYNILYIASVNKDKNKTIYTYNISTVLNWIGITKYDYYKFFIKNKKKTYKYYISRLEKLFKELEKCGINAKMKGLKVKDKNEFYLKEQVIVDLTVFKNNLIKQVKNTD